MGLVGSSVCLFVCVARRRCPVVMWTFRLPHKWEMMASNNIAKIDAERSKRIPVGRPRRQEQIDGHGPRSSSVSEGEVEGLAEAGRRKGLGEEVRLLVQRLTEADGAYSRGDGAEDEGDVDADVAHAA